MTVFYCDWMVYLYLFDQCILFLYFGRGDVMRYADSVLITTILLIIDLARVIFVLR